MPQTSGDSMRLVRQPRLSVLATVTALLVATQAQGPAAAADVFFVTPAGSDTNPGTQERPWRSIERGMRALQPGDTLYVRGGTYAERVLPVARPATATSPILVQAYKGERVVVRGLLRLEGADYWTVDGINVTRDDAPYDSGQTLVKFRDGVGWTFRNAAVWGARSYAAVRVEGTGGSEPANWRITGSCIHDTAAIHPPYQDHNIYVDTGLRAGKGVIERNLIFGAPNGQNIKLGPGGDMSTGAANVTVRYNTMWNAVQNVLASWRSHDIVVERNILGKAFRPPDKPWYPNVRGHSLTGANNVVRDNLGVDNGNFLFNDEGSSPGFRDGGGNRHPVNPVFDGTTTCAGFHPSASSARLYGRYAPEPPTARAIDDACPPDQVREDGFADVPPTYPHEFAIDCVVWRRIASGTSSSTYSPERGVTRGQMASFIANLIRSSGGQLPANPPDRFVDDDDSIHQEAINALAEAGLVAGKTEDRYAPRETVTRGQMASFLVRAYEYRSDTRLAASTDWFDDDETSPHETAINRAASAGFTGGTAAGQYRPGGAVTRGQMASFLARVLDLLTEKGFAA